MSDKIFCDTNIVLRLNVLETPEHEQVKSAISQLIKGGAELWISRQVVREFCAVLTRPQIFLQSVTSDVAVTRAKTMLTVFRIADENEKVMEQLFTLMETSHFGGKQVHDANIVATMLVHDIKQLITLNTADFARFSHFIKMMTPEEVLKGIE